MVGLLSYFQKPVLRGWLSDWDAVKTVKRAGGLDLSLSLKVDLERVRATLADSEESLADCNAAMRKGLSSRVRRQR